MDEWAVVYRKCTVLMHFSCRACMSAIELPIRALDKGAVWSIPDEELRPWFLSHRMPESWVVKELT